MANGKCETLGDGEKSASLCEPEIFCMLVLRDRGWVVGKPVNVNPGLNFNYSIIFSSLKM